MTYKIPTILVVEDEILLLEAITKKLKLNDINALACSTGKQAFDYLSTLPELPDVIWLDYYLKDTNGLLFMQELKKNPIWADIPIVIVSNSASPEKVQTLLALGAKDYILKAEHRLEEVVATVERIAREAQKGRESA